MENAEYKENANLQNMVGNFISSYAQRDTTVDFSSWLSDRLRQELPDLTPEASAKLTAEIVAAVAGYDKTLQELNAAVAAGQSKEEWLSGQLEAIYQDMPVEEAGKALQRMEAELVSSNAQLMAKLDPATIEDPAPAGAEPVEWNKYSVKDTTNKIGRQASMLVLSAAANAMNRTVEDGESGGIGAVINDALQGNLQTEPGEVKAVVAGAVRAAAEKGLADRLPQDTPVEVIGDLAGAAVEGAMALCDAANGNIGKTEVVDRVGRAGVAAGCRIGAGALRGYVKNLPGGFILVDLLGGLFDHIESSTFVNDIYAVIRTTAVATWKGIQESKTVKTGRRILKTVKQAFRS